MVVDQPLTCSFQAGSNISRNLVQNPTLLLGEACLGSTMLDCCLPGSVSHQSQQGEFSSVIFRYCWVLHVIQLFAKM